MRQLVYISSIRRQAIVDPVTILAQSRRNNARARVTGLLFFDGKRFLQALEGDDASVDTTFARIQQDDRHHALVVLSNRDIERREFGEWAMAYNAPGEDNSDAIDRIARLTANADPTVRATFEGFAKVRRAA
ncbi:BLUF domain-containing protein [Sphingomonadaceae bacterium OTU29MARTA1]|uniref:BLUF domain-containing protein n=1 Tax=Sphingomonas sp. Leaf37 TaxID=2876552 RepID=UPI001E2F713D|nr:BLUF domain-containing protein [Sphingomonas sp. Leaf37]USU09652.1 BLUF domain-containing protein [Sphingomonadaceae bacterium OTU29MARTA1]USU13085.1 BLUF domain-containing protein [Sphingomonadaceae bacterium OTU29THOMA1]